MPTCVATSLLGLDKPTYALRAPHSPLGSQGLTAFPSLGNLVITWAKNRQNLTLPGEVGKVQRLGHSVLQGSVPGDSNHPPSAGDGLLSSGTVTERGSGAEDV